jgi:hypothetical protein
MWICLTWLFLVIPKPTNRSSKSGVLARATYSGSYRNTYFGICTTQFYKYTSKALQKKWITPLWRHTLQQKCQFCNPFLGLVSLSPNFHIYVSVSDSYIPRIGPHIWLQQNRPTDPGNTVYKLQIYECRNWETEHWRYRPARLDLHESGIIGKPFKRTSTAICYSFFYFWSWIFH